MPNPVTTDERAGPTGPRARLAALVENTRVQNAIIILILVNAVTLGLETSAAVMATKLFGAEFPHYFGSLGTSLFSLFQIMTLENWPDIAREVMTRYPHAWTFFMVFILLATFTVLNLFIALIVNAMQSAHTSVEAASEPPRPAGDIESLRDEIKALRADLAERTVNRNPGQ